MSRTSVNPFNGSLLPHLSQDEYEPRQNAQSRANPFENGRPDDDCEPRRRLALFHFEKYCQIREPSYEIPDIGSTSKDVSRDSESMRRHRTHLQVTTDLMNSELVMLKDILERMSPRARTHAFRGDVGFALSALLSMIGASTVFLQRTHIVDLIYVICGVSGIHGAYRTLYWWAVSACTHNIEVMQEKLERGTLRDSHIRYLEGAPWSVLRVANL